MELRYRGSQHVWIDLFNYSASGEIELKCMLHSINGKFPLAYRLIAREWIQHVNEIKA